jgi:NagD protein
MKLDNFNGIQNDVLPELMEQLRGVKHVALDMDGTIYNGSTLFPYTISFLKGLRENGINYSFLTNNPSKSTSDYLKHLENMGIPATREEMYTSALATIDYIKSHHPEAKRLFLLGTPSMIKEFEDAGFESTADDAEDKPDALVVAFDSSLTYTRLCRAAYWASQQLPYIATNPDWVCPTDKPTILVDCGSICACIEAATKRSPNIVIGKPDPRMLEGIVHRYSLHPSEIAMVGDRLYTDVKMAENANAVGVLVLSGEATMEDTFHSDVKPHVIADNVARFGELLLASRT